MTVAELIEKLNAFPGGARVVVVGYETGADDIEEPREVRLRLDAYPQRYYGPHEVASEGEPAVLIGDKRNWSRVAL